MPCIAPYPDWTACPGPVVTGVGGVDVSAQSLCLPHYRMKWGESAVPAPAKADPATVLLLHGESLSDEKGHPFTVSGGVAVSTAQSKWGGSSLLFPGGADYLTSPDSPDWSLGAGDFTIECQVYFNALIGLETLLAQWSTTPGFSGWVWRFDNAVPRLSFYSSPDGVSTSSSAQVNWAPATGQWYHLAAVRSGGNMTMFVNGIQTGISQPLAATFDPATPLTVGAHSTGGWPFNGHLDEVRISKTARYTANFTPPSAPWN